MALLAWLTTGDPRRALAVLVVATPCPLILAVPVAIISGMSRTARNGALIKDGAVLEALARVRTAILDKTGTLTRGRPTISLIKSVPTVSAEEILRLAASLDQASGHPVATSLVEAAAKEGLDLLPPTDVAETPGKGIEGNVGGRHVAIGGDVYVGARSVDTENLLGELEAPTGGLSVAVAVDGKVVGGILLQDQLREDAHSTLAALRSVGIERLILASGDDDAVTQAVGSSVGADDIAGGLTPQGKVEIVRRESGKGPVMMVGDGVNDAPALASADVGVALGARGSAASTEAAGVVLLVDQLLPLTKALEIARRTRVIALQSVFGGLGFSLAGMVAAALGHLPPVHGALFQEAIDVVVIVNALRALRG
jgi:heavy metal translocating P-type ATPase